MEKKKCRWVVKNHKTSEEKKLCRDITRKVCKKVSRVLTRDVTKVVNQEKCSLVPVTECKDVEVRCQDRVFSHSKFVSRAKNSCMTIANII